MIEGGHASVVEMLMRFSPVAIALSLTLLAVSCGVNGQKADEYEAYRLLGQAVRIERRLLSACLVTFGFVVTHPGRFSRPLKFL